MICINCDKPLRPQDPPISMVDPRTGERGAICEPCDADIESLHSDPIQRADNPWVVSWSQTREGPDYD